MTTDLNVYVVLWLDTKEWTSNIVAAFSLLTEAQEFCQYEFKEGEVYKIERVPLNVPYTQLENAH